MLENYRNHFEYRSAIIDWIDRSGVTHAITLNTDRDLSAEHLKDIFSLFCKKLDKTAHGRNVRKVRSDERLWAIGFPEKLDTNAHLHVAANLDLLKPAAAVQLGGIERLVWNAWLQSTRGAGTANLKACCSRKWVEYSTKCFRASGGLYWMSADFHPV